MLRLAIEEFADMHDARAATRAHEGEKREVGK
jgi:hypothetical protein